MTQAADLVLLDGEIHPFTPVDAETARESSPDVVAGPDADTPEALAIRDGEVVRTGTTYDVEFLAGTETTVVDLDGAVVVPGFVDAHTHMTTTGRYLVHADLSDATSPAEAVEALEARAREIESEGDDAGGDTGEWILGFGYDESNWTEERYLTREDLDGVSESRPVAAFREDMHVASVNAVVLDRFRSAMPDGDVETEGGEPTGVLLESAIDPVYEAIEPGPAETRTLLAAAIDHATARGVTGVHDMVRKSHAPAVYREMDLAGELPIRVRLNYWSDHLDALIETGLRTNHGGERVQVGAIKTYTDGSFGGRTAKLSEPYADGDGTGQWVVPPAELSELVERADRAGFQVSAHAIGDEAVDAVLAAYEERADDPGDARHRVEHAELASDEAIERFGELGVVASVQPNFLKWAAPGGLYESRLGDRRERTNRYPALLEAGVPLAFGSDGMPLSPLVGIHWAVNAPAESQRLSVTEAIRAYSRGGAYAGFDEDRHGRIEPGVRGDLTVLSASPWETPGRIREIDVAMTVVDGEVVYDGRDGAD